MERPKTAIPKEQAQIFEHIFANGMGNIIIRNEAPTSADLKANTMAYYNNELYLKLANGTLYKFTLTPV